MILCLNLCIEYIIAVHIVDVARYTRICIVMVIYALTSAGPEEIVVTLVWKARVLTAILDS